MDAAQDMVGELDLALVIEAWGVQTVEEVSASLVKGTPFLVVQDGGDRARLFHAEEVLKSPPGLMLDLLAGGRELLSVDAHLPVGSLPRHRPLLVRENGMVKGVLGGEAVTAGNTARRTRRWAMPKGNGANAQAAAMDAVKEARDSFRREGVALILDVQPSRVDGDGTLVRDLVHRLLERSLAILRQNGGGTAVHLKVNDGPEGLTIEVQDRGTRARRMDVEEWLSDEPTSDAAIEDLRKLSNQVSSRRGRMDVMETRTGVVLQVHFPVKPQLAIIG